MKKFDTLLYGNGLTLALFNNFNKVTQIENFNDYFARFLHSKYWSKQDFHKILGSNRHSDIYLKTNEIISVEKFLISNLSEINRNGFEVWIGGKCFETNSLIKNATLYYFSLFNYWYNLNEHLFESSNIQEVIKDCVKTITDLGIKEVHTLNYDTFLENYINVSHIHGKFVPNFYDVKQLDNYRYINDYSKKIEFIYSFGIGTNGLEKLNYLEKLHSAETSNYDYDFLFSTKKYFGNLLIYGIRFADTLLIPESIKTKYSNDELKLVKYVDGHIMYKLDVMYLNKQLESITICYYSDADLERYKRIFAKSECSKILEYIKCSDI